jgi:hypothetical protein
MNDRPSTTGIGCPITAIAHSFRLMKDDRPSNVCRLSDRLMIATVLEHGASSNPTSVFELH